MKKFLSFAISILIIGTFYNLSFGATYYYDDESATDAEVAAQSKTDVYLSPANLPALISGMIDTTLVSADYLLFLDATTGKLAKVGADEVLGGGSSAPADAKYIVQQADGTLSAEQALEALATGLMRSANGTGIIDIVPISSIGEDIAGDGNATAVRATIGCGSAATRNAEDSMTDGANLPDGAAIKIYGDANWSASGGDPGKRYAADYGFSTAESAVNNSTYFDNAVAAMSAGEVLIVPEGTSKINNVVFDPPSGCGLICYGELESNASGTAFTIGVADGSAQRNYYDIQRLRVNSETIDRSADRIGILVKNVYYAKIDIRECRRFWTGIKFLGTNSTGCCYNQTSLGMIYNNKYGLHLDAESNGWTNENSFYGGSFEWQSDTDATGFRHIWLDYYSTHVINSNKFYGPSLEGNPNTADATTTGIYNEGRYNYFFAPRFELKSVCTLINCTTNGWFTTVFFGYQMMDLTTKTLTDDGYMNNFYGHYVQCLSMPTNLKEIPGGDHMSTGFQCSNTNAGESVTLMDCVYFHSDGEWHKTDADATGTSEGLLGISLESKTDGQRMDVVLPNSFVRDATWNWTVGGKIYLSCTTGALTQTAPSAGGDTVRVVGYATHADRMFFDPEGKGTVI